MIEKRHYPKLCGLTKPPHTQRFLGEFLKEAQVDFEKDHLLNQGQLLSLPPILVGLWLLWRAGKDPKNPYGYAPRDLGAEEEKARLALDASCPRCARASVDDRHPTFFDASPEAAAATPGWRRSAGSGRRG